MPQKNSNSSKLTSRQITAKEIKIEQAYYRNEYLHYELYLKLAASEKDRDLKKILTNLSLKELEHRNIWEKELLEHGTQPRRPLFPNLSIFIFKIIRSLFGIAFMIKLLESEEESLLHKYEALMEKQVFNKNKKNLLRIINNEKKSENLLLRELHQYEQKLYYIKSIVFGLNDGLVEILAVVSGLAALAAGSSSFVAIAGLIVDVSGSLSMAAGAYLAAKSQAIVSLSMEHETGKKDEESKTTPLREAYYTGVFYFFGALVPIAPFALGFNGYTGIGIAMVLTAIVLIIASIVISIIGEESIPRRILEMLAVSFGAAVITTIIGTLARIYFGVSL